MTKLKVNDEGIIKPVEYTYKYAKGIFLVEDNKPVVRNCNILGIELESDGDSLELKRIMTKIGRTVILTTTLLGQHFQYIFQDYTEKDDLDRLVSNSAPENKEALTTAFNFAKMNTMGQIDFLGKGLDNKS